jgi:hypothetical protein
LTAVDFLETARNTTPSFSTTQETTTVVLEDGESKEMALTVK